MDNSLTKTLTAGWLSEPPSFPSRVRVGKPLDPDRRRRELPPTASLEEHIDDFVGWMMVGRIPAEDARRNDEWIRDFHSQTGVNFLTLPPEEQAAFVAECDRPAR